jgi:hypothetical protein
MSKLVWDAVGERYYETGVKKGVLYVMDKGAYGNGVAWNGLTAVTEAPSGAEATPLYADDIKYLNLMSAEEFGGTIEAYTYPDEFKACNGEAELVAGISIGQQARKAFGFCYRTVLGNDVDENEHGYKLHLVYGAKAAVSEKAYATINESPEPITFSWEFTTTPVEVEGFKPTSHLVVDSRKFDAEKLALLEAALYGTEDKEAYLPLPDAVATMLKTA